MRSKFVSLLTVVGAITVLVLAGNTVSLATTGKAILAGKINTSTKLTSLTRTTAGTGLQVKTASPANSPFAVNGKGKVANLNADTVDGLDSSVLRNGAYLITKGIAPESANTSVVIPIALPNGTYLVSYSAYLDNGATDGQAYCYLTRGGSTTTYSGEERQTTTAAADPAFSGSGLVSIAAGVTLSLKCSAGTAWSTRADQPIQIVATRTTVLGNTALRVGSTARQSK